MLFLPTAKFGLWDVLHQHNIHAVLRKNQWTGSKLEMNHTQVVTRAHKYIGNFRSLLFPPFLEGIILRDVVCSPP
jgi:hypothetical protein